MKFAIAAVAAAMLVHAESALVGRWDITVKTEKESYPDWMEVVMKDGKPRVRVQPRTGSVHPATDVEMEGSRLKLAVSKAITWEVTASGDKLTGSQKRGAEVAKLEGVRAPELKRPMPKTWSKPEPIFDGKDLTGWEPFQGESHWAVQNGELVNVTKGADLKSTRKFQDFKLHIELNCPDGGNSGIYMRGRYEIQVAYEKEPDNFHSMGSIYGMLAPSREMPRKPGQWESLDATLVGRWITLVRDGETILDHQEIAGITGGALDANEGEPGPFYLQGDHTGGMKYRNITVSVPK
jgi:hypothetical protein